MNVRTESAELSFTEHLASNRYYDRTFEVEAVKVLPPLDEDPWFTYDWKQGGIEVGEDVHFCKLVKRRGITLYVDQDLSKDCGHVGVMTYMLQMVPISQKVVEDEKAAKARGQVSVA